MYSYSLDNFYKQLYINNLHKKFISTLLFVFFSIWLNLFFISSAFSQLSDSTTNESMEIVEVQDSISLDSIMVSKKIKSNFSVGFRGGITSGRFQIANPEESDKNSASVGSVLSIFGNYKLNPRFSIQPELAIGRYRSNNTLYRIAFLEGIVDYTLSTLDMNLLGIYSYPINNWFSISAEAGISGAYTFNSFGKVIAPNVALGIGVYDVNADNQFEKLNYGTLIGISPSFNFKSVSLQASIRYRYGLNNINTFDYTLNRYLEDTSRTIKTRDILFQVGFLIPIYKKNKLKDSLD